MKSDDYQTCSGPMMTTTETVRRGEVTDEEVAKYQLGKSSKTLQASLYLIWDFNQWFFS